MTPHIDSNRFKSFLEKIIQSEYSEEALSFELMYNDHFEALSQGEDILKPQHGGAGNFEAGEGIVEILKFVSLMAGTFSTVLDLIKKAKSLGGEQPKEAEAVDSWTQELIRAGLEKNKATELVARFKSDLLNQIK